MRSTSKAHSKGCFAKKYYDLPLANLSHAGECPKCGHSPHKLVSLQSSNMEVSVRSTSKAHSKGCFAKKYYDLPLANLSHAGECPKCGHSPHKLVSLQSGIMGVSVERTSKAHARGRFAKKF